ncbi:IS5 family transposase [Streptomyces albofaciens JCM 4342]|uniref:IS5 family transposase n=1 Tax=Streptomyces albofaciens TaxID=66866 RepID=UPI001238DCB8|nr:IS5 family transposase [Streptomyces albofaciens]KAA6214931.1 IS5 family transposase [Streptomyces albofaciens JCM 4342]
MSARRRYPSDLSDARWALVEPLLTNWREEIVRRGLNIGHPPRHDLRDLLDAVLYVARTGIPWRYLPHDYPHWNTVYQYFARWEQAGVFEQLNALLRRRVREDEGRTPEPTAMVIDAQSIKTSANVPAAGQGADVGKKIVGRKRSVVIDTTGLLLAVLVTAASIQDSTAGETLLNRIAAAHPTIRKGWADRGYREYLVDRAARLGIDLEIVRRTPGAARGFTVQPRRWCVERTLGWLMLNRRLARDYEALPARSTAMIYIAMIALMTRRLTRETTPTWRGL